jgi:hypothetical protein
MNTAVGIANAAVGTANAAVGESHASDLESNASGAASLGRNRSFKLPDQVSITSRGESKATDRASMIVRRTSKTNGSASRRASCPVDLD